jgi:hypothetical protein
MADNNVFILFKEIKTALKGINNKLEELPKWWRKHHKAKPMSKIYLRLRR